jgi:hypothetical protein
LKQDQEAEFQIVSNTHRKHNPTSALQISAIFNCHGPVGGCFGGQVDITTKTALVNGCKPSLKQDQAEEFPLVSNTYRKHNQASVLQVAVLGD